ncbi:PREDICTED: reelin-like [Priapulus caudatus]|uniref:Reelin-like n=1 Tax=Priapulus caudatus TaxID=37621 RepID=A0ABM1E4J9_PRICU|nr:PREDICTED: reelin-like [Priapulus caudatus]
MDVTSKVALLVLESEVQVRFKVALPVSESEVEVRFKYSFASVDRTTLERGEMRLSVSIADNPRFYEPGKLYQVSVKSSIDFDAFVMMGLYSLPAAVSSAPMQQQQQQQQAAFGAYHAMAAGAHAPFALQPFVCSVTASHTGAPQKQMSFMWQAPPAGAGCMDFLATSSLRGQIILKDTLVMQICEQAVVNVSRSYGPDVGGLERHHVILRDNFDSDTSEDSSVWQAALINYTKSSFLLHPHYTNCFGCTLL